MNTTTFEAIVREERTRAETRLRSWNLDSDADRIRDIPIRLNSRLRRVLGRVRFVGGVAQHIELASSTWLSQSNGAPEHEAALRDTIRHEFAHVVAGPRAGHGPAWQRWARCLDANPSRTCDAVSIGLDTGRSTFKVFCSHCGTVIATQQAHRRPTRWDRRCHRTCAPHPLVVRKVGR